MNHVLDNPFWNALNTHHSCFAKGNEAVKYFDNEVAIFAGLKENNSQYLEQLYCLLPAGSTVILFSVASLDIPYKWEVLSKQKLVQMLYEGKTVDLPLSPQIFPLDTAHVGEMMALASLTRPGPFFVRTIAFGGYEGVFDQKKLVAMAGHRAKVDHYTEISAVCTHPDHVGKGYAKTLLNSQIKCILSQERIPFLHVLTSNVGAIALYKKLGFVIRKEMNVYFIRKTINS